MLFIWGKRNYGAIERVGNISVQTRFGHLWFLPLFPTASYYVDTKAKAAWQLKRINWRSVAFGYARVWLPVVAVLALLIARAEDSSSGALAAAIIGVLAIAAVIATYWYERRPLPLGTAQPRAMMERHFGAAVDPYHCRESLHETIDSKRQAASAETLHPAWYKQEMQDLFIDKAALELALLRARCDRTDTALQQQVLEKMLKPASLV